MEITACPNCGSKKISLATLGDGITIGLSCCKEICRDCGYEGSSVIFRNEEDHKRYLKALKDYQEKLKGSGKE